MKCPNDAATLVMSERAGVEIDYCPECRGVWLDRGELDKILDRAQAEVTRAATPQPAASAASVGQPGRRDRGSSSAGSGTGVPGDPSSNAGSTPSCDTSSGTRCARIVPIRARIESGPDGAVRHGGNSHPPL